MNATVEALKGSVHQVWTRDAASGAAVSFEDDLRGPVVVARWPDGTTVFAPFQVDGEDVMHVCNRLDTLVCRLVREGRQIAELRELARMRIG